MNDDKMLARIAALLRQAEGTDNAHEAEAFMAAAQRLATATSIDLAVARSHTDRRTTAQMPVQRTITIGEAGRAVDTVEQRVEAVAIAVLILAGVGWWTWTGVKESVEGARRTYVRALLEAKVAALEVWVTAKRAEAERWSAAPDVVAAVRTLEAAASSGASREALLASPAQAQFARLLAPAVV